MGFQFLMRTSIFHKLSLPSSYYHCPLPITINKHTALILIKLHNEYANIPTLTSSHGYSSLIK